MPLQPPISTEAFAQKLADKLEPILGHPVTPTQANTAFRTLFNLLADTVVHGNDVVLWGFGRVYLRYYGNNMAEASGTPPYYAALAIRTSHKMRDYMTAMRPKMPSDPRSDPENGPKTP